MAIGVLSYYLQKLGNITNFVPLFLIPNRSKTLHIF